MLAKISTLMAVSAMLLSSITNATPTPEEQSTLLPGLRVLLKGENSTYARSEEMEREYRSRHEATHLSKRSHATVSVCLTASCHECRLVFTGEFDSNTACIPAANVQCLIISELEGANVEFWNRAACIGHNTVYSRCGWEPVMRSAEGTNSIGVHKGCSE